MLCLALGTALCVLLAWRGCGNHLPAVMQATYLAGLELSVVTAIAVLFSAVFLGVGRMLSTAIGDRLFGAPAARGRSRPAQ
jgi:hypothetical protein